MWTAMKERQSQYPYWFSIPIQWGQTNVHEHVPADLILQWVESGRVPLLEALDLLTFDGKKPGVILGKTELSIFEPCNHPDLMHIGTRISDIGQHTFSLETIIFSDRDQRIKAQNLAVLVLYDYAHNCKMDISPDLKRLMRPSMEK